MKKALKRGLSLLLSIAIIFSSAYVGLSEVDFSNLFMINAKATSEAPLTFTINANGDAYTVTDCLSDYSGAVEIPETYNDLPVTAIGTDAFRDCTEITTVTIPDSITSIGGSAAIPAAKVAAVSASVVPESSLVIIIPLVAEGLSKAA